MGASCWIPCAIDSSSTSSTSTAHRGAPERRRADQRRTHVGPVTRLRGSGRREYFDMERGAGGGAGERTLEQAFEQCVSGVARSNRMFERRVSGGRALEQAFKQRVIRGERERESEGGPDTGHRTAHACMRNSNSDISQIWRARDCICPRVSLSTGRTAARAAV